MRVTCPRGTNCQGSTPFNISECFLSEENRNHPPGFISVQLGRDFYGLLARIGLAMTEAKFDVYQCPACGAQVAFVKYKNGMSYKRLGDDIG